MTLHMLDTSALLEGALKEYSNIYLSPIVLSELEGIKTSSHKDQDIKIRARAVVRALIDSYDIEYVAPPQKELKQIIKHHNFLSDINDHLILATAFWMAKKTCEPVEFITSDSALYAFARQMPYLYPTFYVSKEEQEEEYCGYGKYYPDADQWLHLSENSKINILECKTNEFAELYDGSELKNILFWNGEEYRPLKYKDIKNTYIGETIRPRNLEQKMAFDLLQNQDIKVKLLTSAWGSGKTLLALNYALEQVARGTYNKLLFIRNNIIVADTKDIGYLPGDQQSKMSIWGGPIADHLGGQEMLDNLINEGVIEIYPLSHVRGRSIKNTIVLCDECENMNDKLITLLLSRIEESSEIIFCGDVAQIDNPKFEINNGIRSMIKNLAGEPLFGMVKLIKSERGAVARMCDLMRPPV